MHFSSLTYCLLLCLYMRSHSFNTSTLLPLRLLCAMEMCKLCIYTAVSRLCNRQVFVTSAQINFDLNVRPDWTAREVMTRYWHNYWTGPVLPGDLKWFRNYLTTSVFHAAHSLGISEVCVLTWIYWHDPPGRSHRSPCWSSTVVRYGYF